MQYHEAREREEFLTPASQPELRVMQITGDDTRSSENVYMDCNSWSPDSTRFTFWRQPSDDGSKQGGLWLCDTTDRFAISPIVEYDKHASLHDFHATKQAFIGACLAPDGTCVYALFRCQDSVEVRRITLDDGQSSLVCTAPAPFTIRGSLSISCDSRHLLLGVWLGDGQTEGAPWGAYVFDVEKETYGIAEFGNGFRNMHCQYSKNPDAPYDLHIHGDDGRLSDGSWLTPPDGSWRWQDMPPPFPPGEGSITYLHVVRDDGSNWRMIPVGNGREPHSSPFHADFQGIIGVH